MDHLPSYTGTRPDVQALVPSMARRVVDVGCSTGELGRELRAADKYVIGVETDAGFAAKAASVLDEVLCVDAIVGLEELLDRNERADAVIFADVLEHLVDPWHAFDLAALLVGTEGSIIVSIPNVSHWTTHASLARGEWPQRERGIHDSTHLRHFARTNVTALCERSDMKIEQFVRVFRFFDRPSRWDRVARGLGRFVSDPFTYQFIVRSRKAPRAF